MAKYESIAAKLRQHIQTGEFAPGARLAPETTLAMQYGVGLPTMRQALGLLQAEGLIEKRHGRGNFVREARKKINYVNDRFGPGAPPTESTSARNEQAPACGVVVAASIRETAADGDLALDMGVPVGTPLLECAYRSQDVADGAPYSAVRSYLVKDVVNVPDLSVAGASPWGDEYRKWLAGAGIELDHVVERVTARPPSLEETEDLAITPGVAVLAVRRTSIDTRGLVVEIADLVMPGDRVMAVYTTPSTGGPVK